MGTLRRMRELNKRSDSMRPSGAFRILVVVVIVAMGITALAWTVPATGLVPRTARALGYSSIQTYRIDDLRLFGATFLVALVLSAGLVFLVHIVAGRALRTLRR